MLELTHTQMTCTYLYDQFKPAEVSIETSFFPLISVHFGKPTVLSTYYISSMTLSFKKANCSLLLIQLCLMMVTACSQTHRGRVFSAAAH